MSQVPNLFFDKTFFRNLAVCLFERICYIVRYHTTQKADNAFDGKSAYPLGCVYE